MSPKRSERRSAAAARPVFSVVKARTRTARRLVMLVGLLIVAVMFQMTRARAQSASAARPTEDLPPGAMQAKAIAACQECHEARIILQQRLGKAAWAKEVDKMIKWGALVDASDRDALIDYLTTNFDVDKPAYSPPRTSAVKTSGGQGSRQGR